jgi:uncharacterized protein (TIGR02246 family)
MPPSSPEALAAAFGAAIDARDVPAALALWTEDAAIVQADGQVLRGKEAIGAALRVLVGSGADVEIDVAKVFATADVAIVLGTLTMSGTGADGSPYSARSQSLVVYSKGTDGCWRVAIDAPWGLPNV